MDDRSIYSEPVAEVVLMEDIVVASGYDEIEVNDSFAGSWEE